MTWTLLLEQLLNGLQFGLMLFLIAAGLTLVFGIMDIMNLAHGSLYMAGAYVAAETMQRTGSFTAAVLVAAVATGVAGVVLELVLIRRLAVRDHLAQVLGSYAVILIANDLVKMVWGPAPVMLNMPAALSGPVQLLPELMYPAYRHVEHHRSRAPDHLDQVIRSEMHTSEIQSLTKILWRLLLV